MQSYSIYTNNDCTIYHGDVVDVLAQAIPDSSVDLIFADPPYNLGKQFSQFEDKWASDEAYAVWCYGWLDLCINKLKPTGSLYMMTSTQAMPFIDIFLRKKLTILSRIIWSYDSSGVQAKKYYGSLYEPLLFCVKDQKKYVFNADAIMVEAKTGAVRKLVDYRKSEPAQYNATKVPGNSWYFPRVRYRMNEYEDHPSQKPEALLERIIKASSNPGDLVLDLFSGTFTTSAVAKRLNRLSIAVESQEKYIKVGLRRLAIAETYQGEKLSPPSKIFPQNTSCSFQPIDRGSIEIID